MSQDDNTNKIQVPTSILQRIHQRSVTHASKAQGERKKINGIVKEMEEFQGSIQQFHDIIDGASTIVSKATAHENISSSLKSNLKKIKPMIEDIKNTQNDICRESISIIDEMIKSNGVMDDFTDQWEIEFKKFQKVVESKSCVADSLEKMQISIQDMQKVVADHKNAKRDHFLQGDMGN